MHTGGMGCGAEYKNKGPPNFGQINIWIFATAVLGLACGDGRYLSSVGFGGIPKNILTAINQLALVGIERGRDFFFRVVPRVLVRLEFRATVFANANDRGRGDLHDPQASYRHSVSLTHAEDIDSLRGNQRVPLLLFA